MKQVTERIRVSEDILTNLEHYTYPVQKPKVYFTTRSVTTGHTTTVETTYRAAKMLAVARCHDKRYRFCVFTIQSAKS